MVAWVLQYKSLHGKKKEMLKDFALIYAVGVAFLVVDGYMNGLYDLAIMNVVSLLAALAVYLKL